LIAVLKETIEASGLNLVEIARHTQVSPGQLSRFLRGERNLSLLAAEKLVTFFGIKLVRPRPGQAGKN